MPPVGRREFAARLDACDDEAVLAFAAALHEASGLPVEPVGDGRLRVGGEGGRTLSVRPTGDADGGDEARPTDVDGAVTAADLHRRLLYGVDRETADALLATHLDCSLSSFDGTAPEPASWTEDAATTPRSTGDTDPPATADSDPPATVDSGPPSPVGRHASGVVGLRRARTAGSDGASEARPGDARDVPQSDEDARSWRGRPGWPVLAAVVVLILAGLVAGTSGAPVPGLDSGGPTAETVGLDTPTVSPAPRPRSGAIDGPDRGERLGPPTVTPVRLAREGTRRSDPPDGDGTFSDLPPGVRATGEIDENALAAATRAQLTNASYRLTLTYREFVDGQPTAVRREVVRVANATTYAARVSEAGQFRTSPIVLAEGDVYAHGGVRYQRTGTNGTVTREPLAPGDAHEDRYAAAVATRLRWYLSVRESSIAGLAAGHDEAAYWLIVDGDPWPGVEDTTGSALVERDGLVREVYRSYSVPDSPGVTVEIRLRVSAVGETTVSRPSWVPDRE